VIAFSIATLVSFAVHVHLVAYLQDDGYEPTVATTAAGLIGAMQVLGRIVLGLLGDRFPLHVTTAVSLAIQPISLLILLLVPGPIGLFTFIALFGATKGMQTLIRPAYVATLYGRARYASIAGVLAAFVTAANALAPISGGIAHDLFGSYDPLFWSFVVLSIVPVIAVLRARHDAPAREPQPSPAPGPAAESATR